ncbi:hypothetical protein Calag_0483 [Caldisphaera lagunensis DSM 15908]|uniref:Uncharacterized protein n=1 Tax=Caldisphaera lagunensis (strain DSM 15908 / JCM 11604 / ANMR 0165 / IC-154) TaxID=1056495 RepID=L0A9Z9_CALLD|nr:hypothetical protein [Caldisphaera lagunensis]AFZ70249.1 hypothetical protein Calag_0483 [Caldisphaera lagunensis DSM 15908]
MKRVLSEENLNDFEPTPRAGPCIEEFLGNSEELQEVYSVSQNREYDYVDVLIYDDKFSFYLKLFNDIECLHIMYAIIESCNENEKDFLLKLADEPEVYKVIIKGNCIKLIIPSLPLIRITKIMEKAKINSKQILSYRFTDYSENGDNE